MDNGTVQNHSEAGTQAPQQMQAPQQTAVQEMQASPLAQQQQTPWNLKSLTQSPADKTIKAMSDELQRLEAEKPGTRRKLAGIASVGGGVTGICLGIYLLTS